MALSDKERAVVAQIDAMADKICALGRKIFDTPELGYKEHETAETMKEAFEELGLFVADNLALTGLGATVGDGKDFHIAIMGELDSVICKTHAHARQTGEAHACGHAYQLAALYGAACGLVASGVASTLDGAISFLCVPAEEYIDLDFRRKLREEGKIKYFGGKQQLIYEGVFDDVDAAMMVHARPSSHNREVYIHADSLGFLEKQMIFHGKAVHASKPYDGVNALNAAALAILGMHANRERFHEEDKIKVHPIITKGGDVVNSVPDNVVMDCYVRGATMEAIKNASADTDRAVMGAAQMVGAQAEIHTEMGYLPFCQDYELGELFGEVAENFIPKENVKRGVPMTGSSDVGDLCHLLPCIQPMVSGFSGDLHSAEFSLEDEVSGIILPAKILAVTAVRLLDDGCAIGKKIKAQFKPRLTKDEYLSLLDDPS
jgi:amidohydrolase